MNFKQSTPALTLSYTDAKVNKSATYGYREVTTTDIDEFIALNNLYASIPITAKNGHRKTDNIVDVHNWLRLDLDEVGEIDRILPLLKDYFYIAKPSTSNDNVTNLHKWHILIKTSNIVQMDGLSIDEFKFAFKVQSSTALKTIGINSLKDTRASFIPVQNLNANADTNTSISRTIFNDGIALELTTDEDLLTLPTKAPTTTNKTKVPKVKLNSKTSLEYIEAGFVNGNRNNYLFYNYLKMVCEHNILIDDLLDDMMLTNTNGVEPLPDVDVEAIAQNVIKVAQSIRTKANSRSTGRDYKYRLANGIHGLHNIQSYSAFVTNANQVKHTTKLITDALVHIVLNEHEFITNDRLATLTKLSVRTIQRYKYIIDFKQVIKTAIDNKLAMSKDALLNLLTSIKPYVTPISKVYKFAQQRLIKVWDIMTKAPEVLKFELSSDELQRMELYKRYKFQ